jgi:hypothetical protein
MIKNLTTTSYPYIAIKADTGEVICRSSDLEFTRNIAFKHASKYSQEVAVLTLNAVYKHEAVKEHTVGGY